MLRSLQRFRLCDASGDAPNFKQICKVNSLLRMSAADGYRTQLRQARTSGVREAKAAQRTAQGVRLTLL